MYDSIKHTLMARQVGDISRRTRFCPSDETIAAAFDGHSDAALQRHLADCDHCRNRLGMLARLHYGEQDPVNEDLLAAAKQLVHHQGRGFRITTPIRAAAAVAVLALGVILFRPAPNQPDSILSENPSTDRMVRSISDRNRAVQVLSPADGARVDPAMLEVRWSEIEGSLHYNFYVLSDSGELLMQRRTAQTHWNEFDELDLQPGNRYFLYVEARLPDTRTTGSRHILIEMSEDE